MKIYENIVEALIKANGWKGQLGLEIATVKLRVYYDSFQKRPTIKKFNSIYYAVKQGYWKKFMINNWIDMVYRGIGQQTLKN